MTTLNPLGNKPFWVDVFRTYRPVNGTHLGFRMPSRSSADQAIRPGPNPVYRLKVTPWIPHDGGPCPVGFDAMVRVKTRDGWIDDGLYRAGWWAREGGEECEDWWRHEGNEDHNIIAYQIVK